jgi:hypothetical protein
MAVSRPQRLFRLLRAAGTVGLARQADHRRADANAIRLRDRRQLSASRPEPWCGRRAAFVSR